MFCKSKEIADKAKFCRFVAFGSSVYTALTQIIIGKNNCPLSIFGHRKRAPPFVVISRFDRVPCFEQSMQNADKIKKIHILYAKKTSPPNKLKAVYSLKKQGIVTTLKKPSD